MSDSAIKVRPGRFLSTPLPLFADIRSASVEVGKLSKFFSWFGISLKEGGRVSLFKGPNGRANRYLRFQYIRMLKALGAKIEFASVKRKYLYKGAVMEGRVQIPIALH